MENRIGSRLRGMRERRGWTLDDLAFHSRISLRQLSRIESGKSEPKIGTLATLASVFQTDVSRFLVGVEEEAVEQLVDENTCPACGALLVTRVFVDHEYGDCEFETFQCGATRGWENRPCATDPRFPRLDEYGFDFLDHDEDGWTCFARALTDNASRLHLNSGHGPTKTIAEAKVRREYIRIRDGWGEADRQFPKLDWPADPIEV